MNNVPAKTSIPRSNQQNSYEWDAGFSLTYSVSGFTKECMDVIKEFDEFENQELSITQQKTQLELYSEKPRVYAKQKFDILNFWRANQFRYP